MLAAHCPQCGADNPVSVAELERYDCRFCHYQGPPADGVRKRLEQAQVVLSDLDRQRLQLSFQQQRALDFGSTWEVAYAVLLVVVTLPSFALARGCSGLPTIVTGAMAFLLAYGPLVAVFVFGGWGLRTMRRRRLALEEACSASPPPAPGEPARCHVCGAPLTPEPDAVRARCGYCRADNLVSESALRRQRTRQARVYGNYADAILRDASNLEQQAGGTGLRLLALAVVAPLLAIAVVAIVAVTSLFSPFGPVDHSREYLMVRAGPQRCVALLKHDRLYLGRPSQPVSVPGELPLPPPPDRERVRPEDLVGRRVWVDQRTSGIVRRAFSNPHGGGNQLEVDCAGQTHYRLVTGTCLLSIDLEGKER